MGSRLFADARAGMLDTMVCKANYMDVSDICRLCGVERKYIIHVILECEKLGIREKELEIVIGLSEEMDWDEMRITKGRLGKWKRMVDDIEEYERK